MVSSGCRFLGVGGPTVDTVLDAGACPAGAHCRARSISSAAPSTTMWSTSR